MKPHSRLRLARKDAGFNEATEAAKAFGWNPVTYLSHENGTRGLRPSIAERYARAFRVPAEWLLYGKGISTKKRVEDGKTAPLVGYVSAGTAHFFLDGNLEQVPAPTDSGDATVALEIRDSFGVFFDRWLIFYDDVRRPATADLLNRICVVGLKDGRIMVKKVRQSRTKGLFHLLSQMDPPILDVEIEWAAAVTGMAPRR